MSVSGAELRYVPPPAPASRVRYLVANQGTPEERRFPFDDRLEIGRADAARPSAPGLLLISDTTVSWHHCVLTGTADGRIFVRDTSRNGTRVNSRRLAPNVEHEIRVGQVLTIGANCEFVLVADEAVPTGIVPSGGQTIGVPGHTIATVLVGDIRNYTTLVRRAPTAGLQQSISRTFDLLAAHVAGLGGTVKEFQGDAVLAFWEGSLAGEQAVAACHAALALDRLAEQMARDLSIWQVPDFPLVLEWALATGPVVIDTFGGERPAGLALIGEAVVLAFRIEKFATEATGRILTCQTTRDLAQDHFRFRDLGEMTAKGLDRAERVFALEGKTADADAIGRPERRP